MEKRYNNDLGFNYNWFLKELEAQTIEEPLYHSIVKEKRKINAEKLSPEATAGETNIVLILAKIKAKVVRERIKVKHKMWVFYIFALHPLFVFLWERLSNSCVNMIFIMNTL